MVVSTKSFWRACCAFPTRVLLGAVRLYQVAVSPVLPAVFGPTYGCRFHPSCSEYAKQSLQQHGALRGALLAMYRIARCAPYSAGGFDPVPAARPPVRQRHVCRRVTV